MPLLDGATYVFDRAYNDYRWYHDMSLHDIRFVGRMKTNARFEVQEDLSVFEDGVLEDQLICLSSPKAKKECPIILRRIRFKRQEDGKVMPTKKSLQQLARLVSVNIMQRRDLGEFLTNVAPPPKRKLTSNSKQLALINA